MKPETEAICLFIMQCIMTRSIETLKKVRRRRYKTFTKQRIIQVEKIMKEEGSVCGLIILLLVHTFPLVISAR